MANEFATFRQLEGEEIVVDVLPSKLWTAGLYVVTLGLWAIWRGRHHFILTNQRVVVRKGIVSKSQSAVPIERIQDAGLTTSILSGGSVRLSSAGGTLGVEKIGPLTRADAVRFSDELHTLIAASHKPAV